MSHGMYRACTDFRFSLFLWCWISSLSLSISFLRVITSNRRNKLPCLTNWFTFSEIVCSLILSPTLPDISFERISFGFILIRIRLILEVITVMKTELLFKIFVKQVVTLGHPDMFYHTCFQIEKNSRNNRLIFWEELKKKAEKKVPPSSYNTMPHYFPTEQVDIVRKMKSKRRVRRRKKK